jgi:hypothetical protein
VAELIQNSKIMMPVSRQSLLVKSSNNKNGSSSLQELMKMEMRAFEQESCTDTVCNVKNEENITEKRLHPVIEELKPDNDDEIYTSINYKESVGVGSNRGRLGQGGITSNKS